MKNSNFWPLDFDPEGEVYESVSWDLPGYKRRAPSAKRKKPAKVNPGLTKKTH